MHDHKLYVFTVPKAGTYFLAGLMSWFGWQDSGWHMAERFVLETHRADLTTNARNPLAVRIAQPYMETLDKLPKGQMCFGHMNPMLFAAPHAAEVAIVACRRRLRDVLVAEFIDFRFRREDKWVGQFSPKAIPDDREAFAAYVRLHGPVIADIAGTFITHRALRQTPYWAGTRRLASYVEVAFEDLMGEDPLPAVRALAASCGVSAPDGRLLDILQTAKAAENKTKATTLALPFERAELWTAQAEAAYREHGFPHLSTLLGYPEI